MATSEHKQSLQAVLLDVGDTDGRRRGAVALAAASLHADDDEQRRASRD